MNEQETIADIIAEMRDLGKLDEKSTDKIPRTFLGLRLRTYADRLGAAHKREKAAIEADALAVGGIVEAERKRERGDCAKLREALDESRRIASDLGGCRLNDYWKLNEIVRVCEAALAAPPRNCDRFKDALDAWDAYDAWVDSYRSQGKTEPFNEFGWLFAPATEPEGGSAHA